MDYSDKKLIELLIKRNERFKDVRRNWETNVWEPAREFVRPQADSMISGRTEMSGQKRGQTAFDGTPGWAAMIMQNGLQSGLTPEEYQWFKWSIAPIGGDPKAFNREPSVKKWLQNAEEWAYSAMNGSNYSESTLEIYRQQIEMGTGCKYIEHDVGTTLNCQKISLKNVTFAENSKRVIDTCFREFKWSARNAIKEWGKDKVPTVIKQADESGNPDAEFSFLHAVFPREDADPRRRDKFNMPHASLWIYAPEQLLLAEGGYRIFPFSVPRWDMEDEGPWGRGPATQAMWDIASLNQMEKTNLIAGHKMADPPMGIPDGFDKVVNLNPGQHTRYDPRLGEIKPIVTGINLPYAVEMQERKARAVERYFLVDVFLMLADNPKMTATEVLERKQEKLVILGPTIGRQKREHIDHDLDVIFSIGIENGYIDQPPDIVLEYGDKISTNYVSPLALAQGRLDSQATTRLYRAASEIVQLTGRTDAIDMLKDEEAMRIIHDRESAPVEILMTREEYAELQQAKQEKQQAMQAQQEALAMTQGAKDLGTIKTGPGQENAAVDLARMATEGAA